MRTVHTSDRHHFRPSSLPVKFTSGEIYFRSSGIEHIILPMNEIQGNRLVYDGRRNIYVYNNPRIEPAIFDGGIHLNGDRQYVDVGQNVVCGGSLVNCHRGMTLRYKVNPAELEDNTYFVSSAPIDVYYRNGRMYVEARTPDKTWRVNRQSLQPNDWSQVDVSWDPIGGLSLYHNGQLVDSMNQPEDNREPYDGDRTFYIGRHYTDMRDERYVNGIIDDFQVWNARRDILISDGHIINGKANAHA